MSLIPVFKIGLWNAWIFMVLLLVPTTVFPMLIAKEKMDKKMEMDVLFTISFITAPVEEPITTGIFAISRNPGYLSFFLMCVGIGIACASWVFLLFALVWIAAWQFGIPGEEHNLINKYGDAYREYMQRTPRWIGLPKK